MSTLSKLQTYMAGWKALLPASLVLSALSAIAAMVPYILIWFIIREFLTQEGQASSGLIYSYAGWAAGLAVTSILIYFLALSASHLAAFRVECNMRRVAMQKIINLPWDFLTRTPPAASAKSSTTMPASLTVSWRT